MQLTDLEQRLMEALLAGDHPVLAQLRAQFAAATPRQREMTGCGFFRDFEVPTSIPRIDTTHWVISDISLDFPTLQNGAQIMLLVSDGAISMLEGVTNAGEEAWPLNEAGLSFSYHRRSRPILPAGWEMVSSPTRDMVLLDDEYTHARSRGVAG
jgi:hypothetical protein